MEIEQKKRKSQKKPAVKLKRGTPRGGGMGIRRPAPTGYVQTKKRNGGASASLRRAETARTPGAGKPLPQQGDLAFEKWIRGMEENVRTGKLQKKRKKIPNLRPS